MINRMTTLPPAIDILGVPVHPLTVDELHEQLADVIACGEQARVLHVNAHGLNLAVEHRWLRDYLNPVSYTHLWSGRIRRSTTPATRSGPTT